MEQFCWVLLSWDISWDAVKMSARAVLIWCLIGTGGSISQFHSYSYMAHSYSWQVGVCFGEKTHVFLYLGLSTGCLNVLMAGWLPSPRVSDPREPCRSLSTLCALAPEVRLCHFQHTLFSHRLAYDRAWRNRKWGHWGHLGGWLPSKASPKFQGWRNKLYLWMRGMARTLWPSLIHQSFQGFSRGPIRRDFVLTELIV